MNNKNFFFVNRSLLHSDRWLSEPFTRGQAWIDLFGLAQHTKGYFRVRGIKIEVERGQLAHSQIILAKRWKWSRGKVNRYLVELENCGDIMLKTVQQNGQQIKFITTLITIVKYNIWQSNDTAKRTADGQQTDSKQDIYNKKDKKDNDNKTPYGELSTVKLTPNEYMKLVELMGEDNVSGLIFELDTYIASTGKRYKSHYATLLNWARRKAGESKSKRKIII